MYVIIAFQSLVECHAKNRKEPHSCEQISPMGEDTCPTSIVFVVLAFRDKPLEEHQKLLWVISTENTSYSLIGTQIFDGTSYNDIISVFESSSEMAYSCEVTQVSIE